MKKLYLYVLVSFFSLHLGAQSVPLVDYNWSTEDIAAKGVTKEQLFASMNRSLIKVNKSVCSNRALIWLYDFKRFYNIDGSKIFLFYTKKTGELGSKTWWYHVSPIIVERGIEYAMDAGFEHGIRSPILVGEWLRKFTSSSVCKEIRANETDLVDRMFRGQVYPESTSYGRYDCYYKKVPAGYWTPTSVAMNLLGVDENGKPVTFERPQIDLDEVLEACKEASTTSLGGIFGSGVRKCKKYLDMLDASEM